MGEKGNDLMDLCTDKDNIRFGGCVGYIRGVGDTMNLLDGIWVNVKPADEQTELGISFAIRRSETHS